MAAGTVGEPSADAELWGRAAEGDRTAFGQLFERHAQAVWNHAYRLTGSWAQAEDLTSATFLTAWRKRAQVALVQESALPWLYAVAGNLARTERRSGARRLRLLRKVPPADDLPDHAESVADRLDGEQRLLAVLDAIGKLPAAQRKVAELCLLGELPTADVAELLGTAEVTVRTNLSRARARLRGRLEEK